MTFTIDGGNIMDMYRYSLSCHLVPPITDRAALPSTAGGGLMASAWFKQTTEKTPVQAHKTAMEASVSAPLQGEGSRPTSTVAPGNVGAARGLVRGQGGG